MAKVADVPDLNSAYAQEEGWRRFEKAVDAALEAKRGAKTKGATKTKRIRRNGANKRRV